MLFRSGEFLKAAASYTKAIKAEPQNHVFYSNRSQAFLKLSKVGKALEDADKCISLAPSFVKGYHRKASALHAGERTDEAFAITTQVNYVAAGTRLFEPGDDSMKIKTEVEKFCVEIEGFRENFVAKAPLEWSEDFTAAYTGLDSFNVLVDEMEERCNHLREMQSLFDLMSPDFRHIKNSCRDVGHLKTVWEIGRAHV